ncbi:MAG: hypothetical protein SGJ27_08805 [Candidatus Melainabacteria bacterium]|nr:hypothetical protein [Candidatus Melainabacteria bacterium]
MHSRHQELDYHVIERPNAAIVNSITQRDDDVARICTRVIDCSQTVDTGFGKPGQPSEESFGYKLSIGNHINTAAGRNSRHHSYLLQVILNKNIVLNATD